MQVTKGPVILNGKTLEAGDGAAVSDERELTIASASGGEALLFDRA